MKIGILFFFSFAYTLSTAQGFEGVIEYEFYFDSKSEMYYSEQLMDHFGSKMTGFYKDGFYKEVTDIPYRGVKLWRHVENKEYFRHRMGGDTLFVRPCEIPSLSYTYEVEIAADTILGHVCDRVRFIQGTSKKDYFFSSAVKTNPTFYMDYTRNAKHMLMQIMQAIPLRIDLFYPDFNVSIEAVSVIEKQHRPDTFQVPKHMVMVLED